MSDLPNPFRKVLNRMMETFAEYQWGALLRSYVLAMRDERKARLAAIMELSVELAKIKAVNIYATAFGEQIIEAIIQGDWKEAEDIVALLTFDDINPLGEEHEKCLVLWDSFLTVTRVACVEAKRRQAGQPSDDN